ncbi:hypothetical protein K438DRAFT_416040 [Mycena galopus ATCC 62051]|nr:hypothetical protein K438DRAFT_416040 [Mycena galopus ATCC 62051]
MHDGATRLPGPGIDPHADPTARMAEQLINPVHTIDTPHPALRNWLAYGCTPSRLLAFDRARTSPLLSTIDRRRRTLLLRQRLLGHGRRRRRRDGGDSVVLDILLIPPPPARTDEAIFTVALLLEFRIRLPNRLPAPALRSGGLLRRQVKARSGGQRRDGRVGVFLRVDLLAARAAAVARRRRMGRRIRPVVRVRVGGRRSGARDGMRGARGRCMGHARDVPVVETGIGVVGLLWGGDTLEPHIVVVFCAGPRRRLVLYPEYCTRELRAQGHQHECARTNVLMLPTSFTIAPTTMRRRRVLRALVPSRQPRFARLALRRMPRLYCGAPPPASPHD